MLTLANVMLWTPATVALLQGSPVGFQLKVRAGIGALVGAFGAFAGISLWLIRPMALRVTRVYLVLLGCAQLETLAMTQMLGPPTDVVHALVPRLAVEAAAGLGGVIFWWLYFSHSRRVKATYGPDAARA
jgi:hypothetical protein